jgi:hypothetical protein
MLPTLQLAPPAGYGVLTTTGRKTGKRRRKCVRVIRRGDRAYLVQLVPPHVGLTRPGAVSGLLLNIKANPHVQLRIGDGHFEGYAEARATSARASLPGEHQRTASVLVRYSTPAHDRTPALTGVEQLAPVESSKSWGDLAEDAESFVGGEGGLVVVLDRRQWLIRPLVRSTTQRRG